MTNRKTLLFLSLAAAGALVVSGIAASTTFLNVNDTVTAEAGEFSVDANDFNLVGEEYVGVAVGEHGNTVRAKFTGVTKNETGLMIGAGRYAMFTNIDPLRSIGGIHFDFLTEAKDSSGILLFFSSQPLDLESIYSGVYSDLNCHFETIWSKTSYNYNFDGSKAEAYRYVLGLVDTVDAPVTITSLSFATPCASEPAPAPTGEFTDWTNELKADMTELIGAPLPAPGHNAYIPNVTYHGAEMYYSSVGAAGEFYGQIIGQGYTPNYQQASGSTYMMILQKKLSETRIATVQFMLSMRTSGLATVQFQYTDTMEWMGSTNGWPAESLASHFSSDFVDALAPIEFDGISFLEAAQPTEHMMRVAYLITPREGFTQKIVDDWVAAMQAKGWDMDSWGVVSESASFNFTMKGRPNWSVSFYINPSQASINFGEAELYEAFPIETLRYKFGNVIPNFSVDGDAYIIEDGSNANSMSVYGYNVSWAQALTYRDALADAGFLLAWAYDESFSMVDVVRGISVSVSKQTDCIYFDFDLAPEGPFNTFDSFGDFAYTAIKQSYYGDMSGFDLGSLPTLPEGGFVLAATTDNGRCLSGAVYNVGQDFLDELLQSAPLDPLTGGYVLLQNYDGAKLILANPSVGEGYCTLKLTVLQNVNTIDYETANMHIAQWVHDSFPADFEPVLIGATDVPLILGNDYSIDFVDGVADDALAAMRAALATDARFAYSEIDDAYVVPGAYAAYSFVRNEKEYPARTEVHIGHYANEVPTALVTVDDLPSDVKSFLAPFAPLPDCGEKYLNSSTFYDYGDGAGEANVMTTFNFDYKAYLSTLEDAGFTEVDNVYVKSTATQYFAVRKETFHLNNVEYVCIRFRVQNFMSATEFADDIGASADLLPASVLANPAFDMGHYDATDFEWRVSLDTDLSALVSDFEAKGWTIETFDPNYEVRCTYLDAVNGSSASFRINFADLHFNCRFTVSNFDFDFVPSKLAFAEMGIYARYTGIFMEIIAPNEGTVGYSGSDRTVSLLVLNGSATNYVDQLQDAGMKVMEYDSGAAEGYDPSSGLYYAITPSGENAFIVRINTSDYPSGDPVLTNEEISEFAEAKGFAGADFNLDLEIQFYYCNYIEATAESLEIFLDAGFKLEVPMEEYLASRGYTFDPDSGVYIRTDDNYLYTIRFDGSLYLKVTRL